MKQLYRVKIATGLEYECIGEESLGIELNQKVVIRCERYLDYANVIEKVGPPIEDEEEFARKRAQQSKGRHIEGQKIPQIMRLATEADVEQAAENDRQSRKAHLQTMERIKAHGLEMKLIHTHFAFDRKLILFQFSADGRVDFRELLRDLSGLFKVRVELRQVGVRDEASILGGIGTCGRPFCCATFLPSFNSINVKMAKQQGLSLNPQNISGCCGRLKCCLQYEAEIYREMNAEMKKRCGGCGRGAGGNEESEKASSAEKTNEKETRNAEEPMFDDEGTIVSAKRFTVPLAAGSEVSAGGKRPARGQQHENRRERLEHAGKGGGNGSRNGGSSGGGNRPQRNPLKHPLPPVAGDGGPSKDEEGGSSQVSRGNRSTDRRRDRRNNDHRREGGDHGQGNHSGEKRGDHPQAAKSEQTGSIGEFGR